jgi:hypothetical protein
MAKGNEIPKVTEKNTKTEILEAFNKVVTELETRATSKLDPVKEATEKAAVAVVNKANTVNTSSIENSINALSSNLKQLQDELAVLNDVKNAIEIKRVELREMFDIEKSAYTLAALINSQNEVREKFDREMVEKKAALGTQLADVTNQILEMKSNFKIEQDKLIAETREARKKEETEYNYEFSRRKKLSDDAFQDEMTKKRKELAVEIENARKELEDERSVVDSREAMVVARENEIKEMQEKIANFPKALEDAVKDAEKKAKDSASQAYAFETRYLKKENEGAVALLENKIETLTTALADEREKNKVLSSKLDEAYARIETLAAKTVDGASNAKLVSTLETALREKSVISGK